MASAKSNVPQQPEKVRAGMGDVTSEFVEVWTDAAFQRATGLWSILDAEGRARAKDVPPLPPETWRRIYRSMRLIRLLDERLTVWQRAGRIGFYADARGQEATVIAPLAAMEDSDWIVPANREGGGALHRGLPLATYVAQQLGNAHDLGKGRQMPGHVVTPRSLRFLPGSSSASTQLPQAAGLAWAAKIKRDNTVVLAYLGEGATSAEDFHTGLNFAAVFRVPVVFVCVNNGWAVSTPASAQSASETFAVKALAYGMPGVRVDGNDPFALYAATHEAAARARRGEGPTLIEAVTYHLGSHGSPDHPSQRRDEAEHALWTARDPLARLATWLRSEGILDDAARSSLDSALNDEIRGVLETEQAVAAPARRSLIEDVYLQPPAALEQQLADLERIRARQR
jgi:pyruvate dehydrogenase E1 component alpha subunit